jgi:hypothetical protein
MGVDMSVNDFDTFNLLKDLEIARDNLYHKQKVICQFLKLNRLRMYNLKVNICT